MSTIGMTLFPLGWAHYLVGGLFIGAGVALLFVATGLVGGMSTLFSSIWSLLSRWPYFQQARFVQSRAWRLVYALGLVLGAALWWVWRGPAGPLSTALPWWQLLIGGVLVGYGARLSNGCTSGHGICGLSSLRLPSLLAVLTFMASGIVTASLVAVFLKG